MRHGCAAGLSGRGWALSEAVTALPYYRDTTGMVRQAKHPLAQVLLTRSDWLTGGSYRPETRSPTGAGRPS
jgi:hypothetical protein